jgi:hypothetical protein
MQPATALQPAATGQTPQGVTQIQPTAPATPSQLPQPQAASPLPAIPQNPQAGPTAQGLNNVAQFYGIPLNATLASNQAQASGKQGTQQLNASQYQEGITEQNLKNQLSPSGYTITNSPSSPDGVSITNSLGQQVSIGTYVNLTGENPAEVLQNSTNPQAQKFVAAYTNLENLMQTMIGASSGNQQAKSQMADYYEANPGLQNMTPQQVTQAFMSQYGQYFGQPQQANAQAPKGVTPTLQSANNPVTTSPYYNQYLQQAFESNPYQTSLQNTGNL